MKTYIASLIEIVINLESTEPVVQRHALQSYVCELSIGISSNGQLVHSSKYIINSKLVIFFLSIKNKIN